MKKIMIGLDDNMDDDLGALAHEHHTTKEALIREAVRDFTKRHRKDEVFREMRAYAEAMASHSVEFVAETDASVDDQILRETKW